MTTAYPLEWPEGWPRTAPDKRQSNSRFSTTFSRARGSLMNELRMLGAKNAVISSWLPVRNDGQPYADAARRRIEDPGVAVYFNLRDRPLVMARDAFWSVHDNLHSIGHAIAHLRGLDRHGGGAMMDRAFAGFSALPAPGQHAKRPWRQVLEAPDMIVITEDQLVLFYRAAAKKAHPDLGGSTEVMSEVNAAYQEAKRELGFGR
jgi:hypothetical protein